MNSLERKVDTLTGSPLPPPGEARDIGEQPREPKLGLWAWLIVLLIVVLLIVGAVPRWRHRQALKAETAELATTTVETMHAAPGVASATVVLPAEIKPFVEAPIYARASGYVKRWAVDIGARVETNQSLADIDTPELDQQLSGARAELVEAEAAEALAHVTADRWAELLKTSSVSEQDNAEKQSDLKLKIAAVDTAKANVQRLADLQSFTHVTAPFAGTITARDIDVGDLISPGKELFRLADLSKLRVYVRAPQTAAPGIAVGQSAILIVPEMPSVKFPAKVVRTAGAIDANSRTMLVELEVDNSKNEIIPGSYGNVTLSDIKQAPALVLPANTLLFRSQGVQVGVVLPDNKVELRNITIGRDFGKSVEVVDGITAKDRIILNPVDSLTGGAIVHAVDAPASEIMQ